MEQKTSATIEDYLSLLFVLQRDGEPFVGARLAELLGVSAPTVTNTLKRMVRDGLVDMQDPKGACLTEKGLKLARSVMRRHMLTEWMLVRMLDIPWASTHAEAHHMEHTISEIIEERLRTSLDDPRTCPHGNPFPGYEYVTTGWKALVEITVGKTVTIRRIHEMAEENAELLRFFESNGLLPGVEVQVLEVLPFNQTITLKAGEHRVILGYLAARYLFVEE